MKNATTATEFLLVLQTLQHPHTIINMKMPHQKKNPPTYEKVLTQLYEMLREKGIIPPYEKLCMEAWYQFNNILRIPGMTVLNDESLIAWKVFETSPKILSLWESHYLSELNNFYLSNYTNYCYINEIADSLLETIGSLEKLEKAAREPQIVERSFFHDINTNKINWDKNGINNHYGFCFEFTNQNGVNQKFFACPLDQAANWECYFKQFCFF